MTNRMKTGMAALAITVGVLTGVQAQDEVLEKLTFSGYLDASAVFQDTKGGDSTETLAVDTLELRVNYDFMDGLKGEAHVSGGSDEDFDLEQAHFVYSLSDEVSVIGGKYLSALGWEAFHAPDLYQFSTSATLVYPGMMNGVGATYKNDSFSLYGAALAGVWDSKDTDLKERGFETQFKTSPIEGLTIQLGYAQEGYGSTNGVAGYDQALVNLWASYSVNGLTLAAEWNEVSDWNANGVDGDGYLLMANYKITEKLGITLRRSALDVDGMTDLTKHTIAPSYAVTDNWTLIAELNTVEDDVVDSEVDTFALESIIVF